MPAIFLGMFAMVLIGRLIQLQVLNHAEYAELASQELSGKDVIYARRGSILDRNGNVLAASVNTWDIYVNSRSWQDSARTKKSSDALAAALKVDATKLREMVTSSKAVDVLVRRDADYETGNAIIAAGLDGVILLPNTNRVNPEGDLAASVLGFTGQDNTGLTGIELEYNEVLQGKPGRAIYERDTTGDPIPFGAYTVEAPRAGEDLVLTIDRYIQEMAESRLAAAIKEHGAKGGSIMVLDPATDEILALATQPGLKYSTLGSLDFGDPKQVQLLNNAAVSSVYEPGSVMKILTAAAAIDSGAVTPDTTYVDNGIAYVYGIPIKNWDDSVYGLQSMTGVLQNSINTGAIFMMQRLEAIRPGGFQQYLEAFGIGRTTGIDFQGEAEGIVRRPTDSGWSPVDLATQAFGQSISVTPVQMLSAVAAAINGGNLMKPHFVKAHVAPNGVRTEVKPEILGRAISEQSSATIRQMLHAVVESPGRFHPGNPKEYSAGGKSGTANVPVPNGYDQTQIASFIGFAPLEKPRILILVKLDNNEDLKTGTVAAGPVFSKLADDILRYLNVRPDAARYVSRP
ncbi:MAG: penicillin-binding protein 2 [Tepidiformaceae bacterium]